MKKATVHRYTRVILMHYTFLNRGGISIEFAQKLKSFEGSNGKRFNTMIDNRHAFTLN